MRSDEIQKTIKKGLGNYRVKQVNISGKPYDLYVFYEDEDLNLFEGFLFTEVTEKSELSHLISRYRAPVSGYVPRLSFLLYKNQLIIKDYRKNRLIRKTLQKINKSFISKLKKSLTNPDESNFNKLFDRTDIIEEFWILYKKSRDYLLDNIKGISDEDERIAFVDNLMMQMLTLWYLQEKRFFDGDTSYFITKFTEMEQKKLFGGFKDYYGLLTHFFGIIGNNVGNQYQEDDTLGKVVVLGPAIFLNGNIDQAAITIPDRWFYKEGMTDTLINTPPKKAGADVPLFNLFESRDWTEGNIDDFVLGAIYEKLITHIERKKLGAYYTPKEITEYICKNTIEPYLIDKVNCETGSDFKSIGEIVESDDKAILLRLFDSLKEIKILDPAVGSAHFLADAIEVLLGVYEKIWDRAKEIGLRRGLEITAADEGGRLKNINLLEISNRDQFKIYVKFFIILSKNIYGVDINQSAINVARARLFLSIAKHFDVGKGCFIRFPNVHFNLRRGNSLIGYVGMGEDSGVKQSTFDVFVGEKEAVYAAEPIRVVSELGDYLSDTARTLGMEGDILEEIRGLNGILSMDRIRWNEFERVLRVKEKLIRILIASLNSEHAMPLNGLIKNITALFGGKLDERFAREHKIDPDALEEIGTFHWGMEFPEVFLERGGFDVVIGNPPYVGQERIGRLKPYFQNQFVTYHGVADLYVYFIEEGVSLLKSGGMFGIIVANKWMHANYGEPLRKWLKQQRIEEIVDFGNLPVFEGTAIYPCILRLGRKEARSTFSATKMETMNFTDLSAYVTERQYVVNQDTLDDGGWSLADRETETLLNKIRDAGVALGEYVDGKIYRGVVTGFNDAFIIDSKTKSRLIEEDPQSAELIKPFLSGKDIGRYRIDWKEEYLLYIPWHFEIEKYPAIKEHLTKFKEGLGNRNKAEIGIRYEWYALQRYAASYPDEFEKPKIIWGNLCIEPPFAFDESGHYVNAPACILISDELYLLGLLNSSLLWYFLKQIAACRAGGFIEAKPIYVKQLPIRIIDSSDPAATARHDQIGDLVARMLDLHKRLATAEVPDEKTTLQQQIDATNRQIDQVVYELYGLTEGEIKVVEGSVK